MLYDWGMSLVSIAKERLLNKMIQIASGGPAGGQTFEKFDKQVLK